VSVTSVVKIEIEISASKLSYMHLEEKMKEIQDSIESSIEDYFMGEYDIEKYYTDYETCEFVNIAHKITKEPIEDN